ncbi:alpha-L-rhamnosidase [Microbacterium sp. 2FI]|uniref:alpha-L-rhamnosidase n=1 Tax=Microbacterium sp. 2FI TaxID=2502193 RepID=UPI002016BFE3|nr:alpha-L-rhamnosidase [Microbacterium sp. 2FI]
MNAFQGAFTAPDEEFDGSPLLRTEVALDAGHGPVVNATMRLSALGVVEAYVNGMAVSEDVLTPGWSSYEWRLRFAVYDVTAILTASLSESDHNRVAIGVALGNGWYRGRLGWHGGAPPYGPELAALVDIEIVFDDGHVQRIVTDDSWRCGPSATTANSLYDGQHIDARRQQIAWNRVGFDDSAWVGTHLVDVDLAKLEPYIGPPVRRQQTITPVRIWESPAGKVLVDYGQNLVGWIRVQVQGDVGDVVTIRHAEVLEHAELGTRPLRSAQATDQFTLSGGVDEFEPTFTFHGFRYAEVEGWPGGLAAVRPENLTAVVVHSELQRIGTFECSNEQLNRLHQNVVWGMRGNFLDVPTDCPQRDERLGWTGDIAAFAPTAAYLYDVKGFLQDWLRDLALEQQHQDGIVPFVVPDILKYMGIPAAFSPLDSTAVWSDAAAWVPWALWQAYGDLDVLQDSFPSMSAHARRVRSLLSDRGIWESGFQFGDWLDPDAPPHEAANAKADPYVVATACAFRTAQIVAESAALTGREAEAEEFHRMADDLRSSFRQAYVRGQRIHSDCTTVYALAIVFGLLESDDLAWAGSRLEELVVESDFHISTGFAGTPFIMDALTSTGSIDTAHRLLLQENCPSWLYPVTMGATTVWERWDSMLPDGTINPGDMTSFNHYALGAVADWMHRSLAGLAPLEPGYRRILFSPQPGNALEWAAATLRTPFGDASVRWSRDNGDVRATVVVPAGTVGVYIDDRLGEVELEPGVHEILLTAPVAARL